MQLISPVDKLFIEFVWFTVSPGLPDHFFFLILEKETMSDNREPTTSISLKYPLITSHQYKSCFSRKATGGGTTSANGEIKPQWPTLWLNTPMFVASQITRVSQLTLHFYDERQWNSCSNCILSCKLSEAGGWKLRHNVSKIKGIWGVHFSVACQSLGWLL